MRVFFVSKNKRRSGRAVERKKNMAKKLSENILVVDFKKDNQAYQAFTELKDAFVDDNYFISQAAIVKKEDGEVVVKDEFERAEKAVDDTLKGGLVGGLVGLLAGPLGALIGGGVGALVGGVKDANESWKNSVVMEYVSECADEGETVLLVIADEKGNTALSEKLEAYDATVARFTVNEVTKEIERAEKAADKAEEKAWKEDVKALKKYYNTEVVENILIVNYKDEADAYKAFSELKDASVDDYYFISQIAIVKNDNGEYIIKDSDERLEKSVNDTLKGGLIGGLIGLLGGPLGALYGSGIGAAIGELKDVGEGLRDFSMIGYVYEGIPNGATVVVLQADERGNEALTKKLNEYDVTIARVSVEKLLDEIERFEELERKREWEEYEAERKRQAEETEKELSDMYNRAGNSFKL